MQANYRPAAPGGLAGTRLTERQLRDLKRQQREARAYADFISCDVIARVTCSMSKRASTLVSNHGSAGVTGSFSSLDLRARSLWAKSGDAGGHSLLGHMFDVAAVAELILEIESDATREWAARAFGLPSSKVNRWIAALVGLHDFGKSIPGFQNKWPEGRVRDESNGLPFPVGSLGITDHASASAALLKELLPSLGVPKPWMLGVLQAISAHHGYNFAAREMLKPNPHLEGPEWQITRKALLDTYWSTVEPEGLPGCDDLSLASVAWLAGLTSVADWIASNHAWFPLGERSDSVKGHFECAKGLAVDALLQIGWTSYRPLDASPLETTQLIQRILQNATIHPRPLQVAGDDLLQKAVGPSLLLVEAPMGEGKTELGYLAHLRLQAANQHRGMYIALPTRATGNAMFDRTISFLKAFPGDEHLDIQLVHGGTMLNERVEHLREMYGEQGDDINSSAWFSQRRRALLSPYGVGTVDQALFATLNVKHHFVRLWGLSNRVVILDEVHAYDTYTSGLIEALLGWLKALGCSVVIMSATLPIERRNALLEAWGVQPNMIPDLRYPRIMLADERGVHGSTFESRSLPPIRVVPIDESVESLAARALECVAQGGCGAVIVNTVDRAQELYRKLKPSCSGTALTLFHARFPANERAAIEATLMATFGKAGNRPQQALLIATQVAEQSLDVDFDFLLTDLAPVDLVLQRAGRLHRHQRTRPAFHAQARLYVAGLNTGHLPNLKETKWEFVYDPYILGRSWAFLSREPVLQLPADIDRLVQTVYGDTPLPEHLPEEAKSFIATALGKHLASIGKERQLAINAALDPLKEPQTAYLNKPRGNEDGDGLGIQNRTRLGADGISLVPVHGVEGGWSAYPHGLSFDPQQRLSDELAKVLFMRQISLSRKDVVLHFAAQEPPASFAQHPLLRHLKPLVFESGTCCVGSLRLHLDEELGVVYEKASQL
jgi:CRISPR-associated endonuclease/helicase Cas3